MILGDAVEETRLWEGESRRAHTHSYSLHHRNYRPDFVVSANEQMANDLQRASLELHCVTSGLQELCGMEELQKSTISQFTDKRWLFVIGMSS